jgi:hypothetical protein
MRPAFKDPGGLLPAGDSGFRLRCGNEAGVQDAGAGEGEISLFRFQESLL